MGSPGETAPSRVFMNTLGNFLPAGDDQIDRVIVAKIASDGADRWRACPRKSGEFPWFLSTKVPSPLFRQRTLPGAGALSGNVKGCAVDSTAKSVKRVR